MPESDQGHGADKFVFDQDEHGNGENKQKLLIAKANKVAPLAPGPSRQLHHTLTLVYPPHAYKAGS